MSPTIQASDNVSTGSFYFLIAFLTDTKFLRPFHIKTPLKVEVLSQLLYSSKSKKYRLWTV